MSHGKRHNTKLEEKKRESSAQPSLNKDELTLSPEALNYIPMQLEQWQEDLLRMTYSHVIKR